MIKKQNIFTDKHGILGKTFSANNGMKFVVEHMVAKNTYAVKFVNSNYETSVPFSAIKNGTIYDPYAPVYFGVGCKGMVKVKDYKNEYHRWYYLLSKCYNEFDTQYKFYGKLGFKVCERWLCFEKFLEDFPQLIGYDPKLVKSGKFKLIHRHRREDPSVPTNVFCKETIKIVSNQKQRGKPTLPGAQFQRSVNPNKGIYYLRNAGGYCVKIHYNHQTHYIGYTTDKQEAEDMRFYALDGFGVTLEDYIGTTTD